MVLKPSRITEEQTGSERLSSLSKVTQQGKWKNWDVKPRWSCSEAYALDNSAKLPSALREVQEEGQCGDKDSAWGMWGNKVEHPVACSR